MTKKIFRSFMVSAAAVLLAAVAIVMTCLYSYFASVQENQLQDQLQLAAAAVETPAMRATSFTVIRLFFLFIRRFVCSAYLFPEVINIRPNHKKKIIDNFLTPANYSPCDNVLSF